MSQEFIHPAMGEEVPAIGGRYTFLKEEVLDFAGREVLYLVGAGVFDCSCCGSGGCGFAWVAGYLEAKNIKQDAAGRRVSRVSPVTADEEKSKIAALIKEKEGILQVNFLA